jgi:hypothetical protein
MKDYYNRGAMPDLFSGGTRPAMKSISSSIPDLCGRLPPGPDLLALPGEPSRRAGSPGLRRRHVLPATGIAVLSWQHWE